MVPFFCWLRLRISAVQMKRDRPLRSGLPGSQQASAATPYLLGFFIVSTTVVVGRRIAVWTGMNRPVPASRPIRVVFAIWVLPYSKPSGRAALSETTPRCPAVRGSWRESQKRHVKLPDQRLREYSSAFNNSRNRSNCASFWKRCRRLLGSLFGAGPIRGTVRQPLALHA